MPKAGQRIRTYGSDLGFLFRTAYRTAPQVIRDTGLTALCVSAVNTAQLAAIPALVYLIAAARPVWEWCAAVAVVTAVLFCLHGLERLARESFEHSRDAFRTRGCTALAMSVWTRSYPQVTDAAHRSELQRAADAMGRHILAPVPHMWHTLSDLAINLIGAGVTTWLLWQVSGWLVAVTVACTAASAVMHRFVTVRGWRHAAEEAAGDDRLTFLTRIADAPAYSKDIRVFGLSTWMQDIHDRTLQAVRAFAHRRAGLYTWYSVADALLTALRCAAAYGILIGMAASGTVSLPLGVLTVLAVAGLAQSVAALATDAVTLRQELPALSTYRRCVEQENRFRTEGGAQPLAGPLHTLELRHVTFRYPDADEPVLHDVSLTLHEGERLAVVGEDGVGKTTLARLLCGLYDPDEGVVLLDGVDVRTLDRRAYYALFSTVFHDATFPGLTVAQWMNFTDEPTDESRMWACLQQAGMDSVVRALPQGPDTPLGGTQEGQAALSGGQCMRLMLARALYKDGELVVLDEPTAAFDPLAEQHFYQQLHRMTVGKSTVLLSHRALSAQVCDRILYLKNGRITEEGTHESLVARGGDYAALYVLQSRYYREGRDPDGEQ